MANNAVVLPYEYLDEMDALTDEEFGRLIRFLMRYSSTGECTELVGNEKFFAKRVMNVDDYYRERYEKVCERRREAGKKGGIAKASKAKQSLPNLANASKAKQSQANVADTESDKDTDKDTDTDTESDTDSLKRESNNKRFAPPSLDEVAAYCTERGNGINAQSFVDYYAQQGWHLANGNTMKDWKAAVRNWEQRVEYKKPIAVSVPAQPKQPVCSGQQPITREQNDNALRQLRAMMEKQPSEQAETDDDDWPF